MEEKTEDKKESIRQRIVKCIRKIPWHTVFALPWIRLFRWLRRRPLAVCAAMVCLGVIVFSMLLSISSAVRSYSQKRILTVEDLQAKGQKYDCIMVLGCRVYEDGRLSDMLQDRVHVGISLWQAGLCDTLLMSGDSQDPQSYDEVGAMRRAALEAGVPENCIKTDPSGLSTYESVARMARDYAGKSVLIVTQEYHLYRALYIAEKLGLEAYGVGADLRTYGGQFKRDLREVFARCKDVYFALEQPPLHEA